MLHDVILAQAQLELKKQKMAQKKCYSCGATLKDIQVNGKIGCAICYDVFSEELFPLIDLVQNPMPKKTEDICHIGKSPKSIHNEIILNFLEQELLLRLQKSVKKEDYEQANNVKNKLKELELYKTEKKEIIKFIKRSLEFGEYDGIAAGKEKIDNLYLRVRKDFSLYIP